MLRHFMYILSKHSGVKLQKLETFVTLQKLCSCKKKQKLCWVLTIHIICRMVLKKIYKKVKSTTKSGNPQMKVSMSQGMEKAL